jgi:hypothetical protein
MKIAPVPSPSGRNAERLYMFKLPTSTAPRAVQMALDSALKRRAGGDEKPDEGGMSAKVELEKLLAAHLHGHEYARALDLLHGIGVAAPDGGEFEQQEAEDDEDVDEEELREQRRRTMAKVADFLSKEKNLDDEEIFDAMKTFPAPGLEHLGGALAEDLEQVMNRHRRTAGDARRRQQAFDTRFPMASRIDGTALETLYGASLPERRIATDSATAFRVAERWPLAMRIR